MEFLPLHSAFEGKSKGGKTGVRDLGLGVREERKNRIQNSGVRSQNPEYKTGSAGLVVSQMRSAECGKTGIGDSGLGIRGKT
jgi:hypothetical protein